MLVGYWPEASLNQLPCEALTWHLFTCFQQSKQERTEGGTRQKGLVSVTQFQGWHHVTLHVLFIRCKSLGLAYTQQKRIIEGCEYLKSWVVAVCHGWANRSVEMVNNLPKVTQIVSGGARIKLQVIWLPWRSSVKNPLANSLDVGLISSPERLRLLRHNEPHVLQLLSPHTWEPMIHNKGSHCRGARALQLESSPCSLQLEKACLQQWRPMQPKINKYNEKKQTKKHPQLVNSRACAFKMFTTMLTVCSRCNVISNYVSNPLWTRVLVVQLSPTLCYSIECSLCPWNSPGKHAGVGCHSLLQGIFPTQGSNSGLPHCR